MGSNQGEARGNAQNFEGVVDQASKQAHDVDTHSAQQSDAQIIQRFRLAEGAQRKREEETVLNFTDHHDFQSQDEDARRIGRWAWKEESQTLSPVWQPVPYRQLQAKSHGGGEAFHATERRQVPKVLMHAHL